MFSKVLRRTHMYLALFLTPWMLMYALSTIVMNHRDFFREYYGGGLMRYEKEREQTYTGTFPADARPRMVAEQILSDLDLDGAYRVQGRLDRGRITIFRHDPVTPSKIIYTPENGKLRIERAVFRSPTVLVGLHHRRGYQHEYALEDTWGFSVDLVIVAMVFWVASGLWMWWELKVTRRWGALCLAAGIGLFGFFLITI
jgi:hypothetical protein